MGLMFFFGVNLSDWVWGPGVPMKTMDGGAVKQTKNVGIFSMANC